MSWYDKSVLYQIYPLGFCGAPKHNTGKCVNRIQKVKQFIPYYEELGIDTILFNPVFESDRHGYDTRDFNKIDVRLGTNEEFKEVCDTLHKSGIRIILDGVFNHVGRGFFAFQDVLENKQESKYQDWFFIHFDQNNGYHDGFSYEGWEGHYELVKLNLRNEQVVSYLFDAISMWIREFGIDGLRLDVAYSLDRDFLKRLRSFTRAQKDEFLLIGEVLFGDYNLLVNDEMLHSCTNYECYKGIHSSLNDLNLFEINYSLNRQFNQKQNGIYCKKKLMNFVDNHDVSRIASIVKNKELLFLAYTLLFTMPGIPSIYYGSEWGIEGEKQHGDDGLRPNIKQPVKNACYYFHKQLIEIYHKEPCLQYGSYETISITNKQLAYKREFEGEQIIVAMNAEDKPFTVSMPGIDQQMEDVITKKKVSICTQVELAPYEVVIMKNK